VGPKVLLGWFGHFAALAAFTLAYHALRPLQRLLPGLRRSYTYQRLLDALRYGSGSDYRQFSSAGEVSAVGKDHDRAPGGGGSSSSSSSSKAAGAAQQQPHAAAAGVANNAVVAPATLGAVVVGPQQQHVQQQALGSV
jgi:hypothetical protein